MSSALALCALPGFTSYASSKFAVDGFSRMLRKELKMFGIPVITMTPGAYATPILNNSKTLHEKHFEEHEQSKKEYGDKYIKEYEALVKKTTMLGDPNEVIDTLMNALTAEHPRPRYIVGMDGLFLNAISLLPDNYQDVVT
eukprot:CAMPEP_0168514714 /NCGR_PEP_ID=MMETSP0405-20121227/4284_1 /TAXON_ID=498012 /ORGANISM="Trichosphaerium sp, Strain Am-I-7 wt" /LENGTH=140 /DNA_ID=CAMNT_0008533913 /DNA_START=351 /DNA_END=769 /DNA_ORIENTATION=+